MAYGRTGDARRLCYPEDAGDVVLRLDGAAIRGRGRLDPYFGTVVRDLVCGLAVAEDDLARCGIKAESLVGEDRGDLAQAGLFD